MKRTLLSFTLAAAALSPMLATAASSVQMRVAGTIYPASCDISMPGGTTVDYGRIASGTLNKDSVTQIGSGVRAKIEVSCLAPTMFAIRPTDSRAATKVGIPGKSSEILFGLGKAGNANLGAYTVRFVNAKGADGRSLNVIRMDESGKNPVENADLQPNKLSGFGDGVGKVVVTHKGVRADVELGTYIQKASALNLAGEVKLDGLATFEIVYL